MLSYDFISADYRPLIDNFLCPDEETVEFFLKEVALSLHPYGSAITRLYFDDNQNLVGYFTLYNDPTRIAKNQRIKFEKDHGWKLPKYYFFPAIKLHYLGIDIKYRNRGYGKFLLLEAISVAQMMSEYSGCNFVTVEALQSSFDFYRKLGFKWQQRNGQFCNMVFKLSELNG